MTEAFVLSDHEREILAGFRDQGSPPEARRAQIILLHEAGRTPAEIAAEVGLNMNGMRQLANRAEQTPTV